jgi:hypothetical protein
LLHSIHFSPTYLTLPKGSTWPYWDRFSPRYPSRHFTRLSSTPLPRALFWFFILVIYSFEFLIFTVGLFVFYLSRFILIFSPVTVTLFHICVSTCLSCLHSRYFQQLYVVCIHPSLTLVLPYWLSSHHTYFYPVVHSRIYVTVWLSFLLGLLTREESAVGLLVVPKRQKTITTWRRVITKKNVDFMNDRYLSHR